MASADSVPVHHPAQLIKVDIVDLHFKAFKPADPTIDAPDFGVGAGRSDFDAKLKQIAVEAVFESGTDDASAGRPYFMRVAVKGHFKVNTEKFAADKIQKWADTAAPYVLMPYLREQVYALSIRTGFLPVLIPLFQLPVAGVAPVATSQSEQQLALPVSTPVSE